LVLIWAIQETLALSNLSDTNDLAYPEGASRHNLAGTMNVRLGSLNSLSHPAVSLAGLGVEYVICRDSHFSEAVFYLTVGIVCRYNFLLEYSMMICAKRNA